MRRGSADPISTIQCRRICKERINKITRDVRSGRTKPYIKRLEHRLEPWIPKLDQVPFEFTFDPGNFLRGPPKMSMIALVFDRCFDGMGCGIRGNAVKLNNG